MKLAQNTRIEMVFDNCIKLASFISNPAILERHGGTKKFYFH